MNRNKLFEFSFMIGSQTFAAGGGFGLDYDG